MTDALASLGKNDTTFAGGFLRTRIDYFLATRDWRALEELTAEELIETAREWLTDGAYVLGIQPAPERRSSSSGVDRSAPPAPRRVRTVPPAFRRQVFSPC